MRAVTSDGVTREEQTTKGTKQQRGTGNARRAPLSLDTVLSKPFGEGCFVHFARGDGEHGQGRIDLRRFKTASIQMQEQADCEKCRPFVAVDEGMIFRETYGVRSREIGKIGTAVGGEIQRAGECRFEQTVIPNPRSPTMIR